MVGHDVMDEDRESYVDLRIKPDRVERDRDGGRVEYTVGDLHGNPLKLLNFLIRFGFVEYPDEMYGRLVDYIRNYLQYANRRTKLSCVLTFLSNIESHLNVVNKNSLFRCLGDMFSDRCPLPDIFMSAIIYHAVRQGMQIEILLSNHDVNMLDYVCGYYSVKPMTTRSLDLLEDLSSTYPPLGKLFDAHIINSVLPNLKLISCSVAQDYVLRIFSHAPVDLRVIRSIAKKSNLPDIIQTPEDLVKIVFEINRKFREEIACKPGVDISGLTEFMCHLSDSEAESSRRHMIHKIHQPIYFSIWNREVETSGKLFLFKVERDEFINGVPVLWYHGHTQDRVRGTLDDRLGKYSGSHMSCDNWLRGVTKYLVAPDMTIGVRPILFCLQDIQTRHKCSNSSINNLSKFGIFQLLASAKEGICSPETRWIYNKYAENATCLFYSSPVERNVDANIRYMLTRAYGNVAKYLLCNVFWTFTAKRMQEIIYKSFSVSCASQLARSQESASEAVDVILSAI